MADIVLIDDDALLVEALAAMLIASGHEVRTATDGRRGLEAVRERRPDLVITDMIMPEMEGIETIRQVQVLAPDLPIVAISGGGRIGATELLTMATTFGARATLAKPFGRDRLLAVIEECLGPKR